MQLPYIPDEVFEIMHEFSVFLLKDDKHDLGYYRYYRRKGHYYMGRPAPNHPSMLHHWQIGIGGLILAQLGGLLNLARNAMTSNDMVEQMGEGELYDESTVIDLPESAVHEVPTPPLTNHEMIVEDIPTPSIEVSQSPQIQELLIEEEHNNRPLQPIPSLSPLAKL